MYQNRHLRVARVDLPEGLCASYNQLEQSEIFAGPEPAR